MESKGKNYLLVALGVLAIFSLVTVVVRQLPAPSGLVPMQLNSTSITNSMVVERIQKVSKLVSSEITMRDVVVYENTWFGSTKRSLVVVTAKLHAGLNLEDGYQIQIDETARRVNLTLPKARILAVEILDMKTYDERGGLWNPFSAADRDAIFHTARQQFQQSAQEQKLAESAQPSAQELFETMFAKDGYRVTVTFR